MYLLGRNRARVEEAAGTLASHGERVRTLVADVTDRAQVQKAIDKAERGAGRLYMLFNNAGIFRPRLFETAPLEDWRTMIETNLWSVIYGVHSALPILLQQGSGHVMNTPSAAGLDPFPMQDIYNATKYAVVGLSESLRHEHAEKGIAFAVICHGDIATPIYCKVIDREGHGTEGPPTRTPPMPRSPTVSTGLKGIEGSSSCLNSRTLTSGGGTWSGARAWTPFSCRWRTTAGSRSRRRGRTSDAGRPRAPVRVQAVKRAPGKTNNNVFTVP